MDLWDYLAALRRFWWLALGIPLVAFLIALLALPAAPWETQFRALILFPTNPDMAASLGNTEAIILDDAAMLVNSEAFRSDVHAALPADMKATLTADDIAAMLSGTRYSRAVTMRISGDSRDEVSAVAAATEAAFPEAVKTYLMPPEWAQSEVHVIDRTGEPVRQVRERWLAIGAITGAAFLCALGVVALVEALRRSYRAKYGAR